MRKFLSILLVIAILLAFSACAQGPTGEGADASDDEVITALEEALTAMSASISPMMSSSGEPSVQSQMKAIPADKNFSEIFYVLMFTEGSEVMQEYTSLFIPDANARVSKMSATTAYGTFSASLPAFSQSGTNANEDITQHSENLNIRIGDDLSFRVAECKLFDKAGENGVGDTTMTCTGVEYTDKREYQNGPLISFSFKAESTGEVIEISDNMSYVIMDVSLTDLVYKGTPRTVTDAINEAANEFMNYHGGNV